MKQIFFLVNCLETAYVTGQNDRQTQILSGQIVILAGHCPVTGCYFEPWYSWKWLNGLSLSSKTMLRTKTKKEIKLTVQTDPSRI